MPVAPTYPGVYIEEIPSGVHTITGVAPRSRRSSATRRAATSTTPVHIFSFADFERAFGGLAIDSPLSYCVKHFFQNGGTRGVRRARRARAPRPRGDAAQRHRGRVLDIDRGQRRHVGQQPPVDVDYDTANPSSLFNLRSPNSSTERHRWCRAHRGVPEPHAEQLRPELRRRHRERAARSSMPLTRAAGLVSARQGTSASGVLTLADVDRAAGGISAGATAQRRARSRSPLQRRHRRAGARCQR